MATSKKTGTKRIIANILMGAAALINVYEGEIVPTETAVPAIAIINVLLNVLGKRKDK